MLYIYFGNINWILYKMVFDKLQIVSVYKVHSFRYNSGMGFITQFYAFSTQFHNTRQVIGTQCRLSPYTYTSKSYFTNKNGCNFIILLSYSSKYQLSAAWSWIPTGIWLDRVNLYPNPMKHCSFHFKIWIFHCLDWMKWHDVLQFKTGWHFRQMRKIVVYLS